MSKLSAVLILPAAYRDAGNALAVALGHDVAPGYTYNVPLYAIGGDDSITHYGSRAWVTPEFVAIVEAAQQGNYPPGIPAEVAALVMGALIASFLPMDEQSPGDHFDAVASVNGVERRVSPE